MIKPKIKKKNFFVRLITGKNITGITLAPFGIYLREDVYDRQDKKTINHEKIHWQQQLELLIIPFYIFYIIFWIFYGYRNMPFEREAYEHDRDFEYLKNRKMYSWVKYFKK
ncbi:MAG: hypothetical protein ACOC3V_02245 [bacterium]